MRNKNSEFAYVTQVENENLIETNSKDENYVKNNNGKQRHCKKWNKME